MPWAGPSGARPWQLGLSVVWGFVVRTTFACTGRVLRTLGFIAEFTDAVLGLQSRLDLTVALAKG